MTRTLTVLILAGVALAAAVGPPTGRSSTPTAPELYAFYPQAGLLDKDLVLGNFVDIDPSAGIRDFECGALTYDGHAGHDTGIRSFREQQIGVPVFAALDGEVIEAVDGLPDTNTAGSTSQGNFVILEHSGGHTTSYYHLKRGSVDLPIGAHVRAAQQIGLTASSGNSTWPHLHFESKMNGVVFEPFAGDCRPGASGWTQQPRVRRDLIVTRVTLSASDFRGRAGLPFDEGAPRGTFVRGHRSLAFRIELQNQPAHARYDVRVRRPGGRISDGRSGEFDTPYLRGSNWWWRFDNVNLDKIGNWNVVFWMNDVRVSSAPFRVVSRAREAVNRPPVPVSAAVEALEVAGGHAVRCVTLSPLARRDPDYDIVSYTYLWTVDGRRRREVASAALTDMLPVGAADTARAVTCSVTPSDGKAKGATARATAIVGGPSH